MANERKTIVTYKGTGSQKVFAFPFDYLRKSFIKVMIDGNILTYGTDYTVSDKQLTFTNAPALNAIIVIYRETATDRLVAWEDASVLRAGDLTLFEVQLLHIAEETKDKVQEAGLALDDLDGKWDARLKVLKNLLDPVDNLDAVNKRYFESVQAGYIQASQAKVDQATAQANFAQSKANDASASASAARTSELNAKASETAAKTSETNAKASENAAKTSETNAKTSETNARTSETNAANSASQSATSASNAANSATQAYNYMQQTNNAAGYTKAEADGKFAPSGFGLGGGVTVKDDVHRHLPSGFYLTSSAGVDWYVLNLLNPLSTVDNPKFFQMTMDNSNKNLYARVVNDSSEVNKAWKQLASIDVVPKLHCFKFATASQYIASIKPVKVNGLEFTVTPRSASSNFLIIAVINGSMTYVSSSLLFRNGSPILSHGVNNNEPGSQATTYITKSDDYMLHQTIQYVDAPGTTNPVMYDVRCTSGWGGTTYGLYINNRASGDMATPSTLTIIEF